MGSGEAAAFAARRPVLAARQQTPIRTQQDGAVSECQGEQREHGKHTEVAGDGNSGENVVERAAHVGETGEVGGKQGELLVDMGKKGGTGEVARALVEVVERTGDLAEVVERTDELSEVVEMTGVVDEVVGNRRETGMGETGEAAGSDEHVRLQ